MDAHAVLAVARSNAVPADWSVWPVRVDRLRGAALRWTLLSAVGMLFFVPALISTLQSRTFPTGVEFFITGLILITLGFVAFGALGIVLYDIWRLLNAHHYLLVITPDHYVKAEPGNRITHVPMADVAHVTLRGGRLPIERDGDMLGLLGRMMPRRRMTQPPSLAFYDNGRQREVVVSTDDSFDQLGAIEYILSLHVDAHDRKRLRSRSS